MLSFLISDYSRNLFEELSHEDFPDKSDILTVPFLKIVVYSDIEIMLSRRIDMKQRKRIQTGTTPLSRSFFSQPIPQALAAALWIWLMVVFCPAVLSTSGTIEGKPVILSGEDCKPKITKKVAPVYPEKALKARVQGVVLLNVLIDEKGIPGKVEVATGHPLLREAAISAVKEWRWDPYVIEGTARPVVISTTIRFRLDNSKETESTEEHEEQKPVLLKKIAPKYPEQAKKEKIKGVVILKVTIDETGHPIKVQVVKGEEILAQSAVNAVKQWIWKPLKFQGEPHSVIMTVSIRFALK